MSETVFLDRDTLDRGDLDLSALADLSDAWRPIGRTAPDAVSDTIGEARIAITNKCVIGAPTLDACPQLALINVVATGVNNIDVEAARARGVTVTHCRGYGTEAVSQHAITLMLALSTRLVDYHQAVQRGRWAQSPDFCLLDYPIRELAGQTLVVVGYGDLGAAVAHKAEALGMTVQLAERPGVADPRPGRLSFEAGVECADVLTLHCPLTDTTHRMLDAGVMNQCADWLITQRVDDCRAAGIAGHIRRHGADQRIFIRQCLQRRLAPADGTCRMRPLLAIRPRNARLSAIGASRLMARWLRSASADCSSSGPTGS
ncbi:NAD(P)-dependent oxidoreductase, partial [Spiribacter roseus]|uniref:NAD(P)-dependent oxidoreductase n=1 Tax=Spiribacter roseus TaxID=1855875 RepID=UPI00133036F4